MDPKGRLAGCSGSDRARDGGGGALTSLGSSGGKRRWGWDGRATGMTRVVQLNLTISSFLNLRPADVGCARAASSQVRLSDRDLQSPATDR